jgi:hypothetical protein
MITDERFYKFIKALLHRTLNVEVRMLAIETVLRVNYATDFEEKVDSVARQIEERQSAKEIREAVDSLDVVEMLEAFERYQGPVQ